MNIKKLSKRVDRVSFDNIEQGEPFMCGRNLCMRTSAIPKIKGKDYNAVNLATGEMLVFDGNLDVVERCKAHVELYDE